MTTTHLIIKSETFGFRNHQVTCISNYIFLAPIRISKRLGEATITSTISYTRILQFSNTTTFTKGRIQRITI